jgi:protein-tyrosine phosphatase
MTQVVLFVCTGNYYRSRFAELLFNALASQAGLPWEATSRGFILAPSNAGPISSLTLQELASRGIFVNEHVRFPLVLQQADLTAAGMIVALKEAEHRPWFERHFPEWADRVEYWHIHDTDGTPATEACAMIAQEVERLVVRLAIDRHGSEASSTELNGGT